MERYYNDAIGGIHGDNGDDNDNDAVLSSHGGDEIDDENGHATGGEVAGDGHGSVGSHESDNEDSGENHFIVKVRGLPWSATADELIAFFDDARIKSGKEGTHFLLTSQGRPSGEAYVEFESTDDVARALKKDKQYMGKRYVEVYEARYSDMTYDLKRNAPRTGTDADRCILKLRGLPFTCSKDEIVQFFTGLEIAPNGIVLVQDQSGRSTGEAFVRFAACEVATKAMEKHKERIGHRYVEIFASSVRELEVATGVAPPPPSLFARGPPGPPPQMGYHDSYHGNYPPPPPGPGYGYGGHHGGYGGRPTPYDRVPPPPYHRGGRMKGYGDYGYNEPPHHYSYPDPYGPPPPPHHYGSGGPQYGGHHSGYPPHPSGGYGPGPHPPGQPGGPYRGGSGGYPPAAPPPPSSGHRVRMRGLPYSATQQDIYEFFHPMVPANVHFIYLPNGKFSGEVDAEFRSHEEATDAMRFDRKYIDKRYIELFLYSHPTNRSQMDRNDRGLPPPPPLSHAGRSPTGGGYAGGYQTF